MQGTGANGSTIHFERGGTYTGSVQVLGRSDVTFQAYGTGDLPRISGEEEVDDQSWTQHAGNVYRTTLSLNQGDRVKQVYQAGVRMTLAREPNTGWNRTTAVTAFPAPDQLQDNALGAQTGQWVGAEVILRYANWGYERGAVTENTATTLTVVPGAFWRSLGAGWGYFIQDHQAALDAPGEWYYDGTDLFVVGDGNGAPSGITYVVEYDQDELNQGFNINEFSRRITIRDLAISHHAKAGVSVNSSGAIEVEGCSFTEVFTGIADFASLNDTESTTSVYRDNTFNNILDRAFNLGSENLEVEGNTISENGLWPGQGGFGFAHEALVCRGANNTVRDNHIHDVGYTGIAVEGDNSVVEHNRVERAGRILNDAAGITLDNCDNVVIRENIVTDLSSGLEERLGSVSSDIDEYIDITFGIYFGNRPVRNSTVEDNVVTACGAGVHVDHNGDVDNVFGAGTAGNVVRNNTLFNNTVQLSLTDYSNCNSAEFPLDNCIGADQGVGGENLVSAYDTEYSGNILYCLSGGQRLAQHQHTYSSNAGELVNFGVFSNNAYHNPFTDVAVYERVFYAVTNVTGFLGESVIPHTLAGWQNPPAAAPRDLGSTRSPLRLKDFDAFGFTAIPNDGLSADMNGGDLSGWLAGTYTSPVCNDCVQGGHALRAVDQNWIERNGTVMWTNGDDTQGTPVIEPGQYHFTFRMRSPDTDAIRFGPVYQDPSYRQYQYLGLSPEWRTYEMTFNVPDLGGNDYMVSAFQNVQFSLGMLDGSVVELDFIEAKACTLNTGHSATIAQEHILRYHCPLTEVGGQNAGPSFTIPGDPGQCWSDVHGNYYAAGDTYELDEWASVVLFRMDVPASDLVFTNGVHTVSGNVTINTHQNIAGSIVVPSGATLTIDGAHIGFVASTPQLTTNLTVQPGGTLVLKNGATLRNWMGCDAPAAMWDGMKVLGTGTHTGAGLVVMESGARIMNAHIAVVTADVNIAGPFATAANSGGIIQASNSSFLNNRHDVVGCGLTGFDPLAWGPVSFTHCSFVRTKQLPAESGQPGYRCILAQHSPVSFDRCTFRCDATARDGVHQENSILSMNSRVRVIGDEDTGERSKFKGFDWAMVMSAFDPTVLAVVDRCDFDSNAFGLLLAGADNCIVTNSSFKVADAETNADLGVDAAYGAYLFGCSGFEVEENTFTGPGTDHPKVGLVVRNTGIADNMFYNNSFSGFADASERSAGTIIMGANATADYSTGLRIKCNDYDPDASNDYDVAFTGNAVSIASEQGTDISEETSAGNTFALVDPITCDGNEARHLYEDVEGALNPFSYWHHQPQAAVELEPQCNNVLVGLQNTFWDYEKPTSCPVDLSGMVVIEDDEVVVVDADTELEVLVEVYTNWKDGGDTEGLVEFIQDPANTSYSIRNQLMLVAPKVSYDAWKECFFREQAMNPWHLAQALLANSPLEPAVLDLLERSDIDPFYKELVEDGQNGGTSMHSIYKSEIAHFHGVMSSALQAAVRKSLQSGDTASLALALQMHADHPAKGTEIQRFALLLATNDLVEARSLVNDRVAAATDDRELWVVYDMLLDLRERSLGPLDLDANAVDQLQSIANSEAIGAAQAQAWLALLGEPIEEVVWLPNQNKRLKPRRERQTTSTRPLLGAYPNPSNGPVHFTYPVAEGVEQVELRLHDASGRLIANHRLAPKAGIMELDRRDLPTGLLIADLYWDGIRVADAKVAFVK